MKTKLIGLLLSAIVIAVPNMSFEFDSRVEDTPTLSKLKERLITEGYRMPADIMDLPFTIITPVINKEACIELGGLLYSETRLGIFGQTSCAASCHNPNNHLAPKGAQIGSGGFWSNEGRKRLKYFPSDLEIDAPKINTPQAENVIYNFNVLHDCSQTKITQISQDVGSFAHNLDWTAIKGDQIYHHYFTVAFGDSRITELRFQQAILMYQESFVSNQTPFQKWLRHERQLTRKEQEFVKLFFIDYKCQSCHSGAGLNGGGNIMARPVKPHDFFKGELVNTRSVYNTDAFDSYGWGGDYQRLGNFLNQHFKVNAEDGLLKEVPKKDRKKFAKGSNFFCD